MAQQPDHLDVALRFSLQTAARANPVEVTVDVEFEQVGWIKAGPAHRLGVHPGKAGGLQIEAIYKRFNEANRVVQPDIIVDRLRQEQKLRAVCAGEMRHDGLYLGSSRR